MLLPLQCDSPPFDCVSAVSNVQSDAPRRECGTAVGLTWTEPLVFNIPEWCHCNNATTIWVLRACMCGLKTCLRSATLGMPGHLEVVGCNKINNRWLTPVDHTTHVCQDDEGHLPASDYSLHNDVNIHSI